MLITYPLPYIVLDFKFAHHSALQAPSAPPSLYSPCPHYHRRLTSTPTHYTQPNTTPTMPPSQNSTYSGLTAFLIATFCLLALFPSAFVSIIWLPYNSLTGYYFPAAVQRYNVQCVAPNICVANSDTMSWSVLSLPIPSSF
jgi:hypothetical protein